MFLEKSVRSMMHISLALLKWVTVVEVAQLSKAYPRYCERLESSKSRLAATVANLCDTRWNR